MRLRNVSGAREAVADSPWCETQPDKRRGIWREFFGQSAPLHLEIGCGKGRFLADMAGKNPNINYLGIEKYSSVLIRALKKQDEAELDNLRFARMEAEILPEVFAPGEVERIYLNFSDPWPKERHAQRRLPSSNFLRRYEQVLSPDGEVEFKTDNEALFDFAIEESERAGWEILAMSRDLHADSELNAGRSMTEYEARFTALGRPIYFINIHKK